MANIVIESFVYHTHHVHLYRITGECINHIGCPNNHQLQITCPQCFRCVGGVWISIDLEGNNLSLKLSLSTNYSSQYAKATRRGESSSAELSNTCKITHVLNVIS